MLIRYAEYRLTQVMPEIKELATVIKEHAAIQAKLKAQMGASPQIQDGMQVDPALEIGSKSGLPTQDAINAFFARARGGKRAAKVSALNIADRFPVVGTGSRDLAAPNAADERPCESP